MWTALKSDTVSILDWAKKYLKSCAVPNPGVDARSLLSYSRQDVSEFERLVHLRGTRFPLQYILGATNFMGLELKTKTGVFIPRPETEILVEKALQIIGDKPLQILELCTGCGNIAISLTKLANVDKIIASDVSEEAISLAKENAALHDCKNVEFLVSDLFKSIQTSKFDIIISNPPYVAGGDFDTLAQELLHEPSAALYAGTDGLDFYRRILSEAEKFLTQDGCIVLEIGQGQLEGIKQIVNSENLFIKEAVKDYNQIDRVIVVGKNNG